VFVKQQKWVLWFKATKLCNTAVHHHAPIPPNGCKPHFQDSPSPVMTYTHKDRMATAIITKLVSTFYGLT